VKPNRSIPAAAIVPVLIYPDVREAVGWLCGAFGLSIGCGSDRAQLWFGDGAIIVADARSPPGRGHALCDGGCRRLFRRHGASPSCPVGHGRSLREQGRDQMNLHTRATEHRRPTQNLGITHYKLASAAKRAQRGSPIPAAARADRSSENRRRATAFCEEITRPSNAARRSAGTKLSASRRSSVSDMSAPKSNSRVADPACRPAIVRIIFHRSHCARCQVPQ
jgi:hypothetical protein